MERENTLIDKIFLNKWTPFIIIVCTGFILYFQALFFDFSYLDDNNLIIDSQYFISNLSNIGQSFLTDVFHYASHTAFYYRPIMTLSLMFDYQIGGLSPLIYHFTNIIIHLVTSCLIFIFLQKLNYRKDLAFLFSVLFLIHPALSQAVSWIPGRNDSLLALFALSTFIFFIKYLKEEKNVNLILSLIFFSLSIFTKESGIIILTAALFYLFFIYKKENTSKLSFNKFYYFIVTLGIIGLWALLRNIALNSSTPVGLVDIFKSVYLNFPAVLQFIGKIFLPFNLSVLPIMQDTTFIYGIISLIFLIILILFTKEKKWNYLLFGSLWFFGFLLPSFIRPDPLLPADFIEHRLYLPIIGIFIILLETDFIKKINLKKKEVLILIGSLIILFSAITLINSRHFIDRLAFWRNARENSPHYPLAHRNLGAMYYLSNNFENAEKEFKIAIELNPKEPMAHNNLGLIYVNQNKFKEAEEEYKKELEINPNYDNAYFNLGLLYWNQNKNTEAINAWKKTFEINPNFNFPKEVIQILQNYM